MSKITVTSISGLSDYATTVRAFSTDYTSAVNETSRQFSLKLGEGSDPAKAEAVTAFLDRLNNMQTMVFDNVPAALETYATVVSTYENSLSGAGFQSKVWSDDGGAEAVSSALRGAQIDDIHSVKDSLQKAIDKAAEALESSTFDLSPGVTTAESDLATAATNRTDKDGLLQDAYASFVQGLGDSQAELDGLIAPLQNAQYTIQIPASTVMTAIQKGILTGDEMYYFDYLTSKEGFTVIKAVMSRKKSDIEALTELSPNSISEDHYQILAREMSEWTNKHDTSGLAAMNFLLNGMGKKTVEENNVFLDKLAVALTEMAYENEIILLTTVNSSKFKDNPDVMDPFAKREMEYNNLMGFILGTKSLKYGKIITDTPQWNNNIEGYGRAVQEHDVTGTFGFDDEGRIIVTMTHVNTSPKWGNFLSNEVTDTKIIDVSTNEDAFRLDGSFAEYDRLENAKKEVIYKTITDTLLSIGKTAGDFFVPGSSAVTSVLSASVKNDLNSVISGLADGLAEKGEGDARVKAIKSVSDSALETADLMANLTVAAEKYEQLTVAQKQKVDEIRSQFLGQGGYTISEEGSSKNVIQKPGTFDYRVQLRAKELDQYGVTSFINNEANGVDFSVSEYEKVLHQEVKSGNIDENVANYLLGKDSGLTFNTMNDEQLNSFKKGITYLDFNKDKLTDYSNSFPKYISSRYHQIGNISEQLGELHD